MVHPAELVQNAFHDRLLLVLHRHILAVREFIGVPKAVPVLRRERRVVPVGQEPHVDRGGRIGFQGRRPALASRVIGVMGDDFIFAGHPADLAEATPRALFACWSLAHEIVSSSRLNDHRIASEVVSMRPAKADIMGSSCRISNARPMCPSIQTRVTFIRSCAWMRTSTPRSMNSLSVP